MEKSKSYLPLMIGGFLCLFQTGCSMNHGHCKKMKFLSLSSSDSGDGLYITVLSDKYESTSFVSDSRRSLRQTGLNKQDRIEVINEYLCFYKNQNVSNQKFASNFGRSSNRLRLVEEKVKFPIEVEALYSLTSMLFDDNVPISPVLINKKTGENCNFKRHDLDIVYEIYRTWFSQMKNSGFSDMKWPLKNSDYMWLGEDVVDHIETLLRKEI